MQAKFNFKAIFALPFGRLVKFINSPTLPFEAFAGFVLLLGACVQGFAEDFITQKEYAKMLYENPRGISCKHCHGEDGTQQVLEHYTQKGVRKAFVVPSIQSVDFAAFERSLSEVKDAKSVMPTYSLTKQEIKTLFTYIQDFKRDK